MLEWPARRTIALDTARGLTYLHTGIQPAIIHRDIKANNILLDEHLNAHVSDFGLAKVTAEGTTHMTTRVAGTQGYLAPEYALYGQLTEKSDVYSFGVVLLELLSGERAIRKDCNGHVNIVDFAVPRIEGTSGVEIILDERPIAPTGNELEALGMMGRLAVTCVRLEGKERPTMSHIVDVLEKGTSHLYL